MNKSLSRHPQPCRTRSQPRVAGGQHGARRLFLESLEARCLLSAGGVLEYWSPAEHATVAPLRDVSPIRASEYQTFALDRQVLANRLASAPAEFSGHKGLGIALPAPGGKLERFAVFSTAVMAPELASRFPEIQTFAGRGIDDPRATVRLDVTPAGLHAQVLSAERAYYVDPLGAASDKFYASYSASDVSGEVSLRVLELPAAEKAAAVDRLQVLDEETVLARAGGDLATAISSGNELRVYRIAIGATGEYTQFHGGTVAQGLAAVVTALNRITGIYETELSIRFELVADNDRLIFTNPSTDPYSASASPSLLRQNQDTVDSVIGNANYDVGHVFSTQGGGLAFLGTAGLDNSFNVKAQGASGISPPNGDAFWVNVVAHELGHQFGANHTWNGRNGGCGAEQHSQSTAFEPGSGSTIMGYAGICGTDNLQNNADPVYHSVSFEQIINHVDGAIPNVGARIATGNSIPSIDAGGSFTIPAGTPFALTATAGDADGDMLTYSWEQRDLGPQRGVGVPDDGAIPLFRAWLPTTDPARTFPRLPDLLNNTTAIGESFPLTTRPLNFTVTARDGRGGVSSDSTALQVVDTGQVFRITSPNTAVSLPALSQQTVRWEVAGTTGNGIDTASVDILLSTDGGMTFDAVAEETANDGEHEIVLPNLVSSTARIKVAGRGNIFFDVSDTDFALTAPQPGAVAVETGGSTLVGEGSVTDSYQIWLGSVPAGPVTIVASSQGQVELSRDGTSFSPSVALTFTDAGPQTVTVRGVDDDLVEGSHSGRIDHAIISTADAANYPTTLSINEIFTQVADNDLEPFARLQPLGGFVSRSGVQFGRLGAEGLAEFEVALEAGQTISATVTPDDRVALSVEMVGLSEPATSLVAGEAVVLPPVRVGDAGVYRLRVSGAGPTDFSFELLSNASREMSDSGDGHELSIDASRIDIGSGERWALIGGTDPEMTALPQFTRLNDAAAFIDISATGTALNLSDDGVAPINTTVSNPIFGGGSAVVGNNGALVSAGFQAIPFENERLPTAMFETALVPFWDDLSDFAGNVFWRQQPVGGIDTLIVQWHSRPHFESNPSQTVTFQVQVFSAGPLLARYVYRDVSFGDSALDGGASATIGYQAGGTSAVQFSMNSASLSDGDLLELRLVTPDVDEYQLDLTGQAGRPLDFVLASLDGAELVGASFEIVAPDGTTVLATGVPDPVSAGTGASNFDLGIVDFVVPADGVYTLRVEAGVAFDYGVVVTQGLIFDSEPNDGVASSLRLATPLRPAAGYLSEAADPFDSYLVQVEAGKLLTVATGTPFGSAAHSPANTLDPALEVLDAAGTTLLAADSNSAADGRNAVAMLNAPAGGMYRIRVAATSGSGEYSLQVTVEDPLIGLFVSDFAVTSSGFEAEFSEQLEAAGLNLYDTQAAGLGPPDLVLRGAATGSVPGSVVVDETRRRLTFVKTGGPLEDDTYTVTFRSGATAFRSSSLLDGNSDGVAGDDFEQSFTVEGTAGAIVASIPDFVRGPGQAVDLPADTAQGIPLWISDGDGVRAIDLQISYDPRLLSIDAATVAEGMPAGASVVLNNLTPGLAVVVIFSPQVLPAGSNPVVYLSASIPAMDGGAIFGSSQWIDIHSVTISDGNDNEFPVVADDAVHLVTYFGDVSGNGRINASDAAQIARIAALLDTGFASAPLVDPVIVGDVSGNGRINASDASLVAQVAALLPVPQIPPIPAGLLAAAPVAIASGDGWHQREALLIEPLAAGLNAPPLLVSAASEAGRVPAERVLLDLGERSNAAPRTESPLSLQSLSICETREKSLVRRIHG